MSNNTGCHEEMVLRLQLFDIIIKITYKLRGKKCFPIDRFQFRQINLIKYGR